MGEAYPRLELLANTLVLDRFFLELNHFAAEGELVAVCADRLYRLELRPTERAGPVGVGMRC